MTYRIRRAIQDYWFDEETLENILNKYGFRPGSTEWETASAILVKSKKQFERGFSHFNSDDIDRKIRRACMKH